jgi:murein L,D-transpeptidase YafK
LKRPFVRALLTSAAVAAAIALAGCDPQDVTPTGRSQAPLSERMLAEIDSKNMDKGSPILARIFKEDSEMEVWKQNRDGKFALLKTYPICKWSGDLGPKKKQGDRQAPEGFYTITPGQMNPASNYYLAFNTGFPNAYDRAWGYTGSELMVHGDCSSRGCYAMTDEQIQEIYALARESFFAGQKAFQLQAYPFRMTAMNMAKHRSNPNFAFWKMLKDGYDNFEATKQEPKVAVCEKRYVFDAAAPDNASQALSFSPAGKCPVYQLDKNIADAVLDHRRQEQVQMAQYIARDVPVVPPRVGDGGMHPTFVAKLGTHNEYDSNGRVYQVAGNTNALVPGSLPRNASPARVSPSTEAPVTYQTASAEPAKTVTTVRIPQPAPRPKEGEAPAEQPTTIAGLLGNIFGGPKSEPKPATSIVASSDPAGLRGSNTDLAAKPKRPEPVRTASAGPAPQVSTAPLQPKAVAEAAPAAAPKRDVAWPAPKAVAENAPVAAPKPQAAWPTQKPVAEAKPAPTSKAQIEKPPAKEEPQPATMRTAFAAPPPARSNGLLAGAAPVVAAGSFSGR